MEYGNNNWNNGRGQTCRTGKARVDDDEEKRHNRQHHERGGIGKIKGGDDDVGQPGGSLGGQQGVAQGNAYAEENNGTPVDFVDNFLPMHNADFRQHQDGDSNDGAGGGVDNVQLLLCGPQNQKAQRNAQQLELVPADFTHFSQKLFDSLLTTGDFVNFRRHDEHHYMVKRKAHEDSEGSGGKEPVQPRNIYSQLAADEVDGYHVLGGSSFDADVPHAVNLGNRNHQHAGKTAFERYAKGADHTKHNRYEAGHAGGGAGNEKA